MNPTTTHRFSVIDTLVDIGPTLLVLILLSEQAGAGVGALSTIWAAVLSGICVPIVNRLVLMPFLRACQQPRQSITGIVLALSCNAGIAALSFAATLP